MTTKRNNVRSAARVASLLLACTAGCVGAEDESIDDTSSALITGTPTNLRPEIGRLVTPTGACTATLVDTRYIVSAAHCFPSYLSGPVTPGAVNNFTVRDGAGTLIGARDLSMVYALGNNTGPDDIAFARLKTTFPAGTLTPAKFGAAPALDSIVTVFGYGCQHRPNAHDGGFKQYVDYIFGEESVWGCPGDSGGPRVLGEPGDGGTIWGINSAYETEDVPDTGPDIQADASKWGPPILRALQKMGGYALKNTDVSASPDVGFAAQARSAKARAIAGDFDGDGKGDIALVGGTGWTTVPVALGNGAGGFTIKNETIAADFRTWVAVTKNVVAGDFNGDGKTDIALVGGPNWNIVPVAISDGDGSFTLQHWQAPQTILFASMDGAYAVGGDFDGDGKGDIALLGGEGWDHIPMARSNGAGGFVETAKTVTSFPAWSRTAGARAVVGNFDGVQGDDIALLGPWTSIPLATSNRVGGFAVTAQGARDFTDWARVPGAKLVAGDFDSDGDADLAVVGGAGTRAAYFALSNRNGTFANAVLPLPDFPAWANAARFALAGKMDAGAQSDLVLVGGAGWKSVPVTLLKP